MKVKECMVAVKLEKKEVKLPESIEDLNKGDFVQNIEQDYSQSYGIVLDVGDDSVVIKWIQPKTNITYPEDKQEFTILYSNNFEDGYYSIRIATEDEVRMSQI